MRLVVGEVGVGLHGSRHLFELGSLFQFYVDHTAMDTLTQGDGHRERVLHTSLRAHTDAVTHRHARSEVGVAQAFGSQSLHQRTHDAVAARIPSGGNDADGLCLAVQLHESFAIATNLGVDVEAVDGVDAQRQYLPGILFAGARRCSEDSHIDILQFADVAHHVIVGQFGRLLFVTLAAHDARNLEIGCCLQCLHCVAPDVAVTHYGCSDFLHCSFRLFLKDFIGRGSL